MVETNHSSSSEREEDIVELHQHPSTDDDFFTEGEASTSAGRPQPYWEEAGRNNEGEARYETGRPHKRYRAEDCKAGRGSSRQSEEGEASIRSGRPHKRYRAEDCKAGRGSEEREASIRSGRPPRGNGETSRKSGRPDRDGDGQDAHQSPPRNDHRSRSRSVGSYRSDYDSDDESRCDSYVGFKRAIRRRTPSWSSDADSGSDALIRFSEEEARTTSRKRKRSSHHRQRRSSSPGISGRDSDSDYERYKPGGNKKSKTWKLSTNAKKYVQNAFSDYMREQDVEEITGRHARPDYGFLRVPAIDDNIQEGLETVIGKFPAKAVTKRDKTLGSTQEKILSHGTPG